LGWFNVHPGIQSSGAEAVAVAVDAAAAHLEAEEHMTFGEWILGELDD
jgi:hypothetical protein